MFRGHERHPVQLAQFDAGAPVTARHRVILAAALALTRAAACRAAPVNRQHEVEIRDLQSAEIVVTQGDTIVLVDRGIVPHTMTATDSSGTRSTCREPADSRWLPHATGHSCTRVAIIQTCRDRLWCDNPASSGDGSDFPAFSPEQSDTSPESRSRVDPAIDLLTGRFR